MKKEYDNLMIDLYELTMGQVYFNANVADDMAYFDVFYRKNPDNAGFSIAYGIQDCLEYLQQFHFSDEEIKYLKSLNKFSENYLKKLKNLRFTGEVYGVQDGSIILPNEPVLTIKAPMLEAQLVETMLLNIFNHHSLIATKTNRIIRAAKGRGVMEFGSRRAQGIDAAVEGAVSAYVGGAIGTACTSAGMKYDIKVLGTMAHSFVMKMGGDYSSFKEYAKAFPDDSIFSLILTVR